MNLAIPAYAERTDKFTVQALFHPEFTQSDIALERAIGRLQGLIKQELNELHAKPSHLKLLSWSFAPVCHGQVLRLRIDLRRASLVGPVYCVTYRVDNLRVILLPKVPDLFIAWPPHTDLEVTVSAALREHLRKLEKESEAPLDLNDYLSGAEPHITYLNVQSDTSQRFKKSKRSFAALGAEDPMDGAEELQKTGRIFKSSDEFSPVLLQDEIINDLVSTLGRNTSGAKMIVLVGPAGVGKTAILREAVGRWKKKGGATNRGRCYLLAPQRIISGMMYLGEWEQRWLAILEHMAKDKHTLVIDDLIGYFHAGKTNNSDLTLGQVLKAQQEKSSITVLAECTPEVWARLREIDRGFADCFQVVPVREPSDLTTLRIMIRVMQSLEGEHSCRFQTGILPLGIRLLRRFDRVTAFPGKAVEMLRSLAGADSKSVGQQQVIAWFARKFGLSQLLLTTDTPLSRTKVEEALSQRIIGQREAVTAMTDLVMVARTQLNDPGKPLGSLLFTGPTGVGKTECAKALAQYVFESEEQMLRFDMNEYNGPDAVDRLIGTPGKAGLLTSAVRRAPCGLILFDEIEKAHPDVFDLLLQVLGEGRLTDAMGQTADFCNAIIILTSNLGVGQARQQLGFQTRVKDTGTAYREAVEKFFRPEFFNRLDRVVPFTELRREDIAALAGMLAQKALERPGLKSRQLRLKVSNGLVGWLGERGFDQKYGARALRRAVEEHLMEPLARKLSTADFSGASATISLDVAPSGELLVTVQALRQAEQQVQFPTTLSGPEIQWLLRQAKTRLAAMEVTLESDDFRAPEEELAEDSNDLHPLDAWYYSLRDELAELRAAEQDLTMRHEQELYHRRRAGSHRTQTTRIKFHPELRIMPSEVLANAMEMLQQSGTTEKAVADLFDKSVPLQLLHGDVMRLCWRIARLERLAEPRFAEEETLHCPATAHIPREDMESEYRHFESWPFTSLRTIKEPCQGIEVKGHGIADVIASEAAMAARISDTSIVYSSLQSDVQTPALDTILRLDLFQGSIDFRTGLVLTNQSGRFDTLVWAFQAGELPLPPSSDS
jgi:ATP-dependent Clp protease ATP-binding subunit ClpC